MTRSTLPILALICLLAAVTPARSALTFPDPVSRGVDQAELLTVRFVSDTANQASFTTTAPGDLLVEVFGLSRSILAVGAAFGAQSAVGIGDIVTGGSAGSFVLANLASGSHMLDFIGSTTNQGAVGYLGVRLTLTPLPPALLLLAAPLVAAGLLARRRAGA